VPHAPTIRILQLTLFIIPNAQTVGFTDVKQKQNVGYSCYVLQSHPQRLIANELNVSFHRQQDKTMSRLRVFLN
jgi:hypothetical protein